MKVNALGERVAYPQQIHELGKCVQPNGAILFDVNNKPVAVDDERFEDTRIIVLRQPAKVSIAAQVVEKIRTDCSSDDIGRIAVVAFDDVDHTILEALAFQDASHGGT